MRAIITGAASGIGQACARSFVATGEAQELLLVDTAEGALRDVCHDLEREGHRISMACCDLSDADQVAKLAGQAQQMMGGLDLLISNAGVINNAPLVELTLEQYEVSFAVNTRATWLLAKSCYPMLKASKGSIVATASISATHPTPPHGAYSASKSALVMMIKQMAYEFGPDGVRSNCVSPGMIFTGMTDAVYKDPAARAERASHIPLRRVGLPEDIAAAILFLASPAAAYITGVDLMVDGGVSTALMPTLRRANIPS